MTDITYDVIVVGAGHAGCEAAAAAANLGSSTLLITMDMQRMGQMSCNPAMGGVAKGQIVREIDALGGYSGIVSDKSAIQFRMLNLSKGPAMWSPRTQNDRTLFSIEWRKMLEATKNLYFWQDSVVNVLFEGEQVKGVETAMGLTFYCKAVVLTSGTFLNGVIHIGEKRFGGGRMAEKASTGITESLNAIGFESGRMKTGTPPRVDGRSLDYSKMVEQPGDEFPSKFSYLPSIKPLSTQLSCHITYTNTNVHDILREGFDRSPMFSGRIQGLGPRYCPSIEDKIERFSDRDRHQLFVEPEGWDTVEVYVNGFSTSLPEEIQKKAMRLIPGFENVRIFRPGYAIEYDYFPPTQLKSTLETKTIKGLFFAGQINGTTGYEEAAGQGLIAGINAHQSINEKEPFVLSRDEAYIGVLIDDLITKGTEEPYRMFTSRAEFRILLRQDNADKRLTEKSFRIGLAKEDRLLVLHKKYDVVESVKSQLQSIFVSPDSVNTILEKKETSIISQKQSLANLIARPQLNVSDFIHLEPLKGIAENENIAESAEILDAVEILIKYSGYIDKEREMANRINRFEGIVLGDKIDYNSITSLSNEAREKLKKFKPQTLGQAKNISGISPSDISILLISMSK